MHARAILLLTLLLATLPATPAWSQSVVLEPDTLDFGSVAIGSTAARAFSLRNDYGAPIVVESVDIEAVPSDGFAVAAPVPPDSLGPGTTRLFWITFRPADASRRTGVVRIRYRPDRGSSRDTTIPLVARGILATDPNPPLLRISRARIDFPPTVLNETSRLETTLLNAGGGVVEITGVYSLARSGVFGYAVGLDTNRAVRDPRYGLAEAQSRFPVQLTPQGRFDIVATFSPQAMTLDTCFFDTLVVATNVGDRYLVVRACAVPATISVFPTDVDFGSLPVGSCTVASVRITNQSGAPASVLLHPIVPERGSFSIVDSADTAGTLNSLRLVIGAQQTRTVTYRFCARDTGGASAVDTITVGGSPQTVVVRLGGRGVSVWSAPEVIDVGEVTIGTHRDTTVTIVNRSPQPQTRRQVILGPNAGDQAFTILDVIPPENAVVAPGGIVRATIRFAPRVEPEVMTVLEVEPLTNMAIGVRLLGRGARESGEERTVALESTAGSVGEVLGLRVRVAPPLTALQDANDARVRLSMNPRSFQALESPGWTIEEMSRGVVVYRRTASGPVEGDLLATLHLRPLSTARPLDTVWLEDVSIAGERVRIAGAVAVIALEGCDVGRDPGLVPALRVRGIAADPASGVVSIDYTAPPGAQAVVRVIDRAGEALGEIRLPAGTGTPQRHALDLETIPPGMLIVEIRIGEVRHSLPIMHRR